VIALEILHDALPGLGQQVQNALPRNAPGAGTETHSGQTAVANHAVNRAAREAEEVGYFIGPKKPLFPE
jgi:hypothetical protein